MLKSSKASEYQTIVRNLIEYKKKYANEAKKEIISKRNVTENNWQTQRKTWYMHRRITDKRVNNFHHLNLMDIIQAFHSIYGASL